MSRLAAFGVGLVLSLATASMSWAGTYDVVACNSAASGLNHSWKSATNAPAYFSVTTVCPASTADDSGLTASDNLDAPGYAPDGATAQWEFVAVPGTTIHGLRYSRYLGKFSDDDWELFAKTDDERVFDTCTIPLSDVRCSTGQAGYALGTERTVSDLAARAIRFGFVCRPTAGTSTCAVGVNIHRVWASLYSATVTLSDSSAPSLGNVDGSLFDGGYVTGSRFARFDASDNAGIRTGRLYVDGAVASSDTYGCDFTYTVPCADRTQSELSLDTTTLADGQHSVQVAAVDPAGNEAKSSVRTIAVDNGAPSAPVGLSVDDAGWHSVNSFDVSWTNPAGQVAPLVAAHYRICSLEGSGCSLDQEISGVGISRLDGLSVPTTGAWALRVWLEDAAGNVDPRFAAETTLRYGTAPLPQTQPAQTTTTTTADDSSSAAAPVLAAPNLAAQSPAILRRNPRLRITRARLGHGRVIIRGALDRAVRSPVSLTLRLKGHRPLRRRVTPARGRFVLSIHLRALRRGHGSVLARLPGDAAFLPARASRRVH